MEFVEQVLLHKKRGVGGVPLEVSRKNVELVSSSTFFSERSSWS
jgi:hypothetical protein